MVDGQFFDLLAALAVALRSKTNRPFGGIQLVVTGDFFQLPPVTQSGKDVFFAFQSDAWKESIEKTVTLTKVFRQKENHFVELLNELRRGDITPAAKQALTRLSRPLPQDDGLLPTELFPLRSEVDRANAARMVALDGQAHEFKARDSGPAAPAKRQKLLENMMAVKSLELKVESQVMLVKNVSDTLVNGSVGKVLGFMPSPDRKREGDDEMLPLVEFRTFRGKEIVLVSRDEFRVEDSEGKLLARRVQIPLVLAWAMSIHKAQGQTLQRVKVDLNKVFERGNDTNIRNSVGEVR
ncbi:ATP-dependent DNA helicase PIF1 [Cytospora mali]|uniref:ATP-dependent DNA helicase n=1 Tax=Cytospora mali TaxID=578113 RepID=A0A194V0S5_CYTMA|nr:ATP-dependent DNA helicase PIF1 [Valsa mali var. pyri (nom. inval.)]